MSNKNLKISLLFNIIIFIMVLLGTIFMMTGFKFMSNTYVLAATGFTPFKYYTVDSNTLVGLSALLFIIYEYLFINKKISEIPKYVYVLKYISTVAVTLTFLVTLFYLVPAYGENYLFLYQNSNLFFHLCVPLLSLISFTFFEKTDLNFKYTFYGMSTMILYSIFYIINIFIHQENGIVTLEYDWYGFVQGGVSLMVIVLPIMLLVTYIISLVIYKINKLKRI